MKKWFHAIVCVALLAISGCRPDPDLILQNGASVQEAEPSALEEERTDPGGDSQAEHAEPEEDSGEDTGQPEICAYICGAVRSPGVYELEADSRVFQLVELAGGMSEDADEKSVNLAEILTDGQMVWIPTKEESLSGAGISQAGSPAGGTGTELININTASASELMELNGIGETKAEAIIAYREEHGAFGSTEEIMQVSGIGQGTFDKIKDEITV